MCRYLWGSGKGFLKGGVKDASLSIKVQEWVRYMDKKRIGVGADGWVRLRVGVELGRGGGGGGCWSCFDGNIGFEARTCMFIWVCSCIVVHVCGLLAVM